MKEQVSIVIYLKENNVVKKINKDILYDTSETISIFDFDVPTNVSEVYVELNSIVVLKNIEIVSNIGFLKYKNLNGINLDNLDFFITEKPKFAIDCKNRGIEYMRVKMEVYKFYREYAGVLADIICFMKTYNKYKENELEIMKSKNELQEYKKRYLDVIKTKEEAEHNF